MFTQIKTLLTCLLISSVISSFTANAETKFGRGADMGKLTAISTVLSTPEDYLSKEITIKGKVMSVCQNKGCWMKLDLGNNKESMVRFKDYGFFVPLNADHKEVIVNGKAFVTEISIDELRHYAKDAGNSEEEIAAITEPEFTYAFEADGVLMKQ